MQLCLCYVSILLYNLSVVVTFSKFPLLGGGLMTEAMAFDEFLVDDKEYQKLDDVVDIITLILERFDYQGSYDYQSWSFSKALDNEYSLHEHACFWAMFIYLDQELPTPAFAEQFCAEMLSFSALWVHKDVCFFDFISDISTAYDLGEYANIVEFKRAIILKLNSSH